MLLCVDVAGAPPERAAWEEVLDTLDALSPLIEDARPGRAFVELHGIADAPTGMTRARALLRRFAYAWRLGAGANPFCARVAASVADGSICEAGGEAAYLAPLSLALLEIDAEQVERLRLLGIESLGALAALPYGPFVRRFGRDAGAWHERARGIDRTAFRPRGHAVAIEAALFGEGSASDEAQVFFALRMLLARVAVDLERVGMRAGGLNLDLEFEDGTTRGIAVRLALPTGEERAMFDVLRARLEGMTFEAAICGLRLRAERIEERGEPQGLFAADDLDPAGIAVALARLEAALGERVTRAHIHAAHALEGRFTYEPFGIPPRETFASAATALEAAVVPQLRLLAVREVEVRVRAGAPAWVDARAVLECVGPWRIEERAYLSTPVVRDEYDVLLEDGALVRIYRQGTRWYVRGCYD